MEGRPQRPPTKLFPRPSIHLDYLVLHTLRAVLLQVCTPPGRASPGEEVKEGPGVSVLSLNLCDLGQVPGHPLQPPYPWL